MALEDVILFTISALLLALALFVGDKVFGDRNVKLTKSYYINAVITAVVILVLIIGVSAVAGMLSILGIGQIIPILTFVVSVYVIKALLMRGGTYERSTWVGIIAWVMVYIMNYIGEIIGVRLIQFI